MQSKKMSLLESIANTVTGFICAHIVVLLWHKAYDLDIGTTMEVAWTLSFTVVTLVRSYLWRRFFNKRT